MTDRKKSSVAAERLVETMRDSYKVTLEHTAALSERNVQFAQSWIGGYSEELRHQAESNRVLASELLGRTEKQRDALQAVVEESVDAYLDLVYAPLSYYKENLENTGKAAR